MFAPLRASHIDTQFFFFRILQKNFNIDNNLHAFFKNNNVRLVIT